MSLAALAGPLIGAAGSFLGARAGKGLSPNAQLRFETSRLRRLQKEFGISPLAALGTSMAGPVTQVGDPGYGTAAQVLGAGITDMQVRESAAKERDLERELAQAGQAQALKESEARIQKDLAIANAQNSMATHAAAQRKVVPVTPSPSAQPGPFGGQVVIKPDEQVSARPGAPNVTAGTHAGFREHVMSKSGARLVFPYSEEGLHENMESMWAPWYAAAVINASKAQYGAKETARAIAEMYGVSEKVAMFIVSPIDSTKGVYDMIERKGLERRARERHAEKWSGTSGSW